MGETRLARPDPSEHAPYYGLYIRRVPDGDIVETLGRQRDETAAFLAGISEESGGHRYQPGKWSIRQVVGHLSDVERVFAYRALCFARGERAALPSIEQDDYVAAARFDERTLAEIAGEFRAVREASLALFGSLDAERSGWRGTASGFEFTVRSIPWILAGHEIHHLQVIRERYL